MSQQVIEITTKPEQQPWHSPEYAALLNRLRNLRWLTQQAGLEQWLGLLGYDSAAQRSREVQAELRALIAGTAIPDNLEAETDATLNRLLAALVVDLQQIRRKQTP